MSSRLAARDPFLTPVNILLAWGAVSLVCALGMLAGLNPFMLLALVLAVPCCLALFAWPDMASLAVLFVLYSNAAVVAVRFHGVPYAAGAAVPLLLALPLARFVFGARAKFVITPVLSLIALFVLCQFYSSLFSTNPALSLSVVVSSLVEGLGLYFLLTNVIRTPEMLRRATWVLLAAGTMMGGLSLFQQATGTFDKSYGGFAQMSNTAFETGEEDPAAALQRRLAGPLGDQNRYAQIMLMLVPLGFFRISDESRTTMRMAAIAATILIALGLALAFSRGAAVGFALMLATMAFMRYMSWRQCAGIVLGVGLVAVVVPQYAARLMKLEKLTAVVAEEGPGIASADSAVRSRYTEMMAAGLMFSEHPFTGLGPGMYPTFYREYAERVGGNVKDTARQPHTLYIGIAAELGLPGLLMWLAAVTVALVSLERTRRQCLKYAPEHSHLLSGFILAIVAYLATALFLHFAYVRYFWLILAMAGAAEFIVRREIQAARRRETDLPEHRPAAGRRRVQLVS